VVAPWRAQDFVHCWLRRLARRPQLKRDSLGGREVEKGTVRGAFSRTTSTPAAMRLGRQASVGAAPGAGTARCREAAV
jgi:hypothetical protein